MFKFFSLLLLFPVLITSATERAFGREDIDRSQAFSDSAVIYLAKDLPANMNGDSSAFNLAAYPSQPVKEVIKNRIPVSGSLGVTRQGRRIEVYYFPGKTNKRALMLAGVHGSELSAIEVARSVVKQLQTDTPYYSVMVVPSLFPDNAEYAISNYASIGSAGNIGRYTDSFVADPNRQMPPLGKPFSKAWPVDYHGRTIEPENQLLLTLINDFRPHRIANLHAIRSIYNAGIFADPRTESDGTALGFETDSALAIEMARYIYDRGGYVPGNRMNTSPRPLYHLDPTPVEAGQFQKRNFYGSSLSRNRGQGVSLGSWATTAISDAPDSTLNRPAIRLITVEYPGSKRPYDYEDEQQVNDHLSLVELFASAISRVFLGEFFVEEDP